MYRSDCLLGGHIIMLGKGNQEPALSALSAYPQGMQVGGGVNVDNAKGWIEAGASHVIVTSWVFNGGKVDYDRLKMVSGVVAQDCFFFFRDACDRSNTIPPGENSTGRTLHH